MATRITIYANYIRENNNLEKRILSVVPKKIEEIQIDECGMERSGGYGQYKYFITGTINGEYFKFNKHSTSSTTWDWYQECDINRTFINWKKNLIIDLLEDYFNSL